VRKRTTAPGIRSSLAVLSTMVCNAAWSIGLSADEPVVEPGREKESNADQQARVGAYGKFKRHFPNDHCCWVPQNIKDTFIRPNEIKLSDPARGTRELQTRARWPGSLQRMVRRCG
jgi:hypothetical protein